MPSAEFVDTEPEIQPMVEIVIFRPEEHGPQWEEFIVSGYGNAQYVMLSPTYLRWQFRDNPANVTGGYTLWIVLHQGTVIAQLGFVPFVGVSPDGERFDGSYPINLIVRPDFRASGLGAILLGRLLKQMPCVLNPGSSEAGATLGVGLGMRDLGTLRRYLCIIDPAAARRLTLDGCLPDMAGGASQRGDPAAAGDVVIASRLPPEAPESYQFPTAAYGVERSRPYLSWRYEQHPGFRYEFLLTRDLQSVLVFHEECEQTTGARVVRVVDFLARGSAQGTLLAAIVDHARQRNAALIDFFCSSDCYHGALEKAGFFDEAAHAECRVAGLFKPLDFRKTGIRVLLAHGSGGQTHEWFVTKGDSDQDRPNDKRAIRSDRASSGPSNGLLLGRAAPPPLSATAGRRTR